LRSVAAFRSYSARGAEFPARAAMAGIADRQASPKYVSNTRNGSRTPTPGVSVVA
jgi:hypothetical protein